jgi:hypothetical protein
MLMLVMTLFHIRVILVPNPKTPGMTPPKASKTIAPEVEEKVESTVEATNTVNRDW